MGKLAMRVANSFPFPWYSRGVRRHPFRIPLDAQGVLRFSDFLHMMRDALACHNIGAHNLYLELEGRVCR